MITEKIYIRAGVDQKIYFRMVDATQSIPSVKVYLEMNDGDPFIPTIQGSTAPISFRLAQNAPTDVYTPNIYYVARRLQFCYEIDSTLLTDYGTGDIVIIDDRIEPIFVEFEVVHEDDYGATFTQVASLSTNQITNVENALSAYGVPTNTQVLADISNGLTTYGVPVMSALNNLSAAQVLAQVSSALGTYGTAKTSDLTGLTTGLATQASLTTVSNNVSAIKTNTDQLTLANIENQAATAINNASIPGSLTTISQNILNAKSVTDLLTLAAISNAVWANSDRELTSGTGGGATAEDVWTYANRTITSTPTDGATAAEIAALNNVSTTQVYTQIVNALSNSGLLTQAQMTTLLAPIATQASLTAVGNNVSAIKTNTDQLTLANIKTQSANALTDASIPASLTQANTNITAIENIVSQLTLSAISAAIWAYASRSLTSSTGGGATAAEVWAYANRSITAAPSGVALTTDITSLNNLSATQVYTQIVNAMNAQGLITSAQMTTLLQGVATQASMNTANTNIAAIEAITNNLTLANIETQAATALTNASIPGTLTSISQNVINAKATTDLLTLSAITNAIWNAATRSLTTSSGGSGATADEVWAYANRTITAVPTGTALASDLLTANSNISSIKGKTDLLTLTAIANQVWTNTARTLTSSSSGGGITAQDLQAGLTTYGVATSANITAALTTLTTDINQLNDISVNDLLNTVIEGTYTLVQIIRILAAEAAGNESRNGSIVTDVGLDGMTPRLVASCADTGRTITTRNGA